MTFFILDQESYQKVIKKNHVFWQKKKIEKEAFIENSLLTFDMLSNYCTYES